MHGIVCAGVYLKHLYSHHKRVIELFMSIPNMDYIQKCRALKSLPLDKQMFFDKCVLMQTKLLTIKICNT